MDVTVGHVIYGWDARRVCPLEVLTSMRCGLSWRHWCEQLETDRATWFAVAMDRNKRFVVKGHVQVEISEVRLAHLTVRGRVCLAE